MIISQNSNDVYYAYTRGRFWRWDESARVWKESHLLAQKFGKAKAAEKHLTPEAFLTGDEFIPMDDYELPEQMLTALREAKPCKNAPIDPVEEESSSDVPASCICSTCTCAGCKEECFGNCRSCGHPVQECNSYQTEGEKHLTPTHSEDVAEPFGNIPADSSFDFSALGDLSEQAVETDQQFDLHYGTAQDEYLISCIYVAKMHALTAKAGRYGGGTWTKWYESKGMSKSSVWNMLQTGEGFKGSTVEQLTSIPELSRKDLNLIARSGCAEQLTAAAGDSQRVQELLAQLKAKEYKLNETQARLKSACIQEQESRDAMNTANAQLEAANADIKGLKEQNAQLQQSYHDADESRIAANLQRQKAEAERDKAEARAKNAEDALKKQPIVGVTDPEEVRRQADALAAEAKAQARRQIEDAQRRAREAEARYQKLQQDADGFLAPEQSCAQQAKIIADSMRSMYLGWFGLASTAGTPLARMAAPIYQVCDEIRESLEEDTTINPTAEGSVEDAEREALFE